MKMRIGLLPCLFAALVASPISAQDISGGGKVGLSVANLSTDAFNTSTHRGFAAGGFVAIEINDLLSIQPEVMFVQKGSRFGEDGQEVSVNLDYVEVPILVVFTLQTSGHVTPFVYAGPSFGATTSAKAEMDGEEEDLDDEVKGGDVLIVFGGGVDISGFTIEARYEAGVSTIAELGDDTKTSAFMVLAGFSFGS